MKTVTILKPKESYNQNYWKLHNDMPTASLMVHDEYTGKSTYTGISACIEKRTKRGTTLHNYYTLGSGITKIFLSRTEWIEQTIEENGGKEEEE